MSKKVSKEMIWAVYVILIIILIISGYFIGKKNEKGGLYAIIGAILGILISEILWVTVGKKMSEGEGGY